MTRTDILQVDLMLKFRGSRRSVFACLICASCLLTPPAVPVRGQGSYRQPLPASAIAGTPLPAIDHAERRRPIPRLIAIIPGRPWIGASGGYTFPIAEPGAEANRADDAVTPKLAFATRFPLAERPISEGGIWHHLGLSWKSVRTVANHAIGTQSGSGGYDDSYAYLGGFNSDQTAWATLWIDPAIKGDYREVELLLRWSDSPTSARGYECNLSWNGAYAEIVRWNGRFGDFTYITRQTAFDPGIMPPGNGDLFKASISGSTIRVYLNKNDGKGYQLIVTGSDGTFMDGNPGMGFFIQGGRDPGQFGFSDYAASSD